jgi:hypothetical protein
MIGYAWRALRSPYDITAWEALTEAAASWEMNNDERGDGAMPTPADALYEDQYEWTYP